MPATKPADNNVLSLTFRGALPEILRMIADQIENGRATAESFASVVTRDQFELRATIHLNKGV